MSNCKKCGIHIESNNHDEKTCDYEYTDDISVDDIDVRFEIINAGYGIWELNIIYDIMKKLWNLQHPENKIYNSKYLQSNHNLFKIAARIYEDQ